MSMNQDETETRMALMLAALGNENRLRIYRLLVRAGRNGLNVGDVNERLGMPASTLTHHLAALRNAGLVTQRRDGRAIFTTANFQSMDNLLGYLTEECCADEETGDAP